MGKLLFLTIFLILIVGQCLGSQKNMTKQTAKQYKKMIKEITDPIVKLKKEIKKDKFEARKIRAETVIVNPKTLKTKSLSKIEDRSSKWGQWSRCMGCLQRRMMDCLDVRIYEERTCLKKRCKRKIKERLDFNVVHLNKSSNFLLKQGPSEMWSRWQEWSSCSDQCKTTRSRICRKPGKCLKEKQIQTAYCYLKGSYCERVIFQLIDSSRRNTAANRRYEYFNETAPVHTKKRRKCGRPYKKSRMLKIIGGKEAKKYKWPWHVAVINRYDEVFCGGTLIAPRWILTASHCIRSYLKVRINEHDLTAFDGREIEFRVSKMFPHPKFNHRTVDNDIALLQLPMAVKTPVACLPKKQPRDGELCSVMGWGKIKSKNKYGTAILHEAKLPIIPSHTCKNAYKQFLITDNMLCAGWTSGKQDTCAGDSGGGLLCPHSKTKKTFEIRGITSFGDGCGIMNKYGIYTNVNNYVTWINYIIDHYS